MRYLVAMAVVVAVFHIPWINLIPLLSVVSRGQGVFFSNWEIPLVVNKEKFAQDVTDLRR